MSPTDIPLPDSWPALVRVAILHVLGLARYVFVRRGTTKETDACPCSRCLEWERELNLLREELRIKDDRMASIEPRKRPSYSATARFDILALKSSCGWTQAETSRRFFVCEATLRKWKYRVETDGDDAFISAGPPVNRFPDHVGDVVRRLKQHCPAFGKKSIANFLARAGLHVGVSTVGRMLKEPVVPTDEAADGEATETADDAKSSMTDAPTKSKPQVVTAKYPNHLWHVDLTVLPIGGGFWTTWFPFSLPQEWPHCWWLVVVEDHFSRRAMATAKFRQQPSAAEVTTVLDRTAKRAKTYPKHLVCDQGPQFTSDHFETWAETNSVKVRYGAVGQHGSIAVVERLMKTIKYVWFSLGCVTRNAKLMQARLDRCRVWYNQFRPHEALGGATPDEVYFAKPKANEKPRYEPRSRWPRSSPCAKPQAPPKRKACGKLQLEVRFFHNDQALPIVKLRRAA